jgi:biopolymer transport protein ExbB
MLLLQISEGAQAAAGATGEKLTWVGIFLKGGVILIPIVILFFLTVFYIVDRFLAIRRATKIDQSKIAAVRDSLLKGNIDMAQTVCKTDDGIVMKVLGAGIQRLGAPLEEIDGAMSSFANILVGRLTGRINYLGIISGVAPMLGFIGTILGVIRIFYNISLTDNISIGIIAGGLYEKMISSCAGLVVGVIAYGGMHLLNAMIDKFTVSVEAESYEFLNLLQQPANEA